MLKNMSRELNVLGVVTTFFFSFKKIFVSTVSVDANNMSFADNSAKKRKPEKTSYYSFKVIYIKVFSNFNKMFTRYFLDYRIIETKNPQIPGVKNFFNYLQCGKHYIISNYLTLCCRTNSTRKAVLII